MEIPDRLVKPVLAMISGDRQAEEIPRFFGRVVVEGEYRDGQIVKVHRSLTLTEIVRS